MTVLLAALAVIACIILLLFVLPVKLFFRLEGDTDLGFDIRGRIMLYGGLAGIGIRSFRKRSRLRFFIGRTRLFSIDITGASSKFELPRFGKGKKKKDEEKAAEEGEKGTLLERLSSKKDELITYHALFREGMRVLTDTVRFDRVDSELEFGLWNPALTGWLTGIIFSINPFLPPRFTIRPKYRFDSIVAGGSLYVEVTFMLHVLWKNAPRLMAVYRRAKNTGKESQSHELSFQEA